MATSPTAPKSSGGGGGFRPRKSISHATVPPMERRKPNNNTNNGNTTTTNSSASTTTATKQVLWEHINSAPATKREMGDMFYFLDKRNHRSSVAMQSTDWRQSSSRQASNESRTSAGSGVGGGGGGATPSDEAHNAGLENQPLGAGTTAQGQVQYRRPRKLSLRDGALLPCWQSDCGGSLTAAATSSDSAASAAGRSLTKVDEYLADKAANSAAARLYHLKSLSTLMLVEEAASAASPRSFGVVEIEEASGSSLATSGCGCGDGDGGGHGANGNGCELPHAQLYRVEDGVVIPTKLWSELERKALGGGLDQSAGLVSHAGGNASCSDDAEDGEHAAKDNNRHPRQELSDRMAAHGSSSDGTAENRRFQMLIRKLKRLEPHKNAGEGDWSGHDGGMHSAAAAGRDSHYRLRAPSNASLLASLSRIDEYPDGGWEGRAEHDEHDEGGPLTRPSEAKTLNPKALEFVPVVAGDGGKRPHHQQQAATAGPAASPTRRGARRGGVRDLFINPPSSENAAAARLESSTSNTGPAPLPPNVPAGLIHQIAMHLAHQISTQQQQQLGVNVPSLTAMPQLPAMHQQLHPQQQQQQQQQRLAAPPPSNPAPNVTSALGPPSGLGHPNLRPLGSCFVAPMPGGYMTLPPSTAAAMTASIGHVAGTQQQQQQALPFKHHPGLIWQHAMRQPEEAHHSRNSAQSHHHPKPQVRLPSATPHQPAAGYTGDASESAANGEQTAGGGGAASSASAVGHAATAEEAQQQPDPAPPAASTGTPTGAGLPFSAPPSAAKPSATQQPVNLNALGIQQQLQLLQMPVAPGQQQQQQQLTGQAQIQAQAQMQAAAFLQQQMHHQQQQSQQRFAAQPPPTPQIYPQVHPHMHPQSRGFMGAQAAATGGAAATTNAATQAQAQAQAQAVAAAMMARCGVQQQQQQGVNATTAPPSLLQSMGLMPALVASGVAASMPPTATVGPEGVDCITAISYPNAAIPAPAAPLVPASGAAPLPQVVVAAAAAAQAPASAPVPAPAAPRAQFATFPCRKPKYPHSGMQQSYEAWIEFRKAMEPGYAEACRQRQARRYARQVDRTHAEREERAARKTRGCLRGGGAGDARALDADADGADKTAHHHPHEITTGPAVQMSCGDTNGAAGSNGDEGVTNDMAAATEKGAEACAL